MTGGTLVDLCAAERVDGAFGDDEGVEVFRVGAEGEEAARSAGREAPHPVWRADFEAGAGSGVAAFQVVRKSVAACAGFPNLSRMSAKERPRRIMKSIAVPLSSLSHVVKSTQWPLSRRLVTSLGSPGARSTGFARVEASGSRTYPHAAAMVSKGMRLMTSKSTRYGLFRFTPDAPGVAVDGDERGVVDQAVDGACDDSFLPPRHGIGRLSCQTEKPHGKKRMAEWERRHAVPGATAKQSSKPGKINRRRILPAYGTVAV